MDKINESLVTPIKGNYDIIVCGGGVAGVASAVSAARSGVSVLLIEKSIQLGGLATSGLISWNEPICDGEGHLLMTGMPHEFLQLAIKYGPDTIDFGWKDNTENLTDTKRYATFFSPTIFTMALDELVKDNGVDLLFDTTVVLPLMDGKRCRGVFVENKSGRSCYTAKVVIDTTGDSDIFFRSGAPCTEGKNYLTFIGYIVDKNSLIKAYEGGNLLDSRKWTAVGSNLWGKGHPDGFPKFSGVTAEEVTEYIISGRKMFFNKVLEKPRNERDVSVLPTMAQFRTTRRINGAYELTEKDVGRRFDDSIGVAGDFAKRGVAYELPYRMLFCQEYINLLTAGRTVTSSGWAWEITRVIPVAIATGQACGMAAAICAKRDCDVQSIDIIELQENLVEAGVKIHLE
ncbi:MAG: FAD-dependent oxidoreductase [Sphaerochaetaceae bacterium]|jgi:hypothetical protein|nr:FAD-dependent oxidoreductase [Sphaerochaetaceae bacterium]